MFNANHTITIWWLLTKLLWLNHNSNWIAADIRDIANLSGGRCNLSSGFSPFSARMSLRSSRRNEAKPLSLVASQPNSDADVEELKDFRVSDTHSGCLFVSRLHWKNSGRKIYNRTFSRPTPYICMFSTCESYALCILMPLHGIDSRADLFCERRCSRQHQFIEHRSSLKFHVSMGWSMC